MKAISILMLWGFSVLGCGVAPESSAAPPASTGEGVCSCERGAPGVVGPAGAAGPEGAVGERGVAGMAGAQGPAGEPGADGAPGPQGPVGAQGPMGPAGMVGAAGAPGPAGVAGPAGVRGLPGAEGAPGAGPLDVTDSYLVVADVPLPGPSNGVVAEAFCNPTDLLVGGACTAGDGGFGVSTELPLHVQGSPKFGGGNFSSGTQGWHCSARSHGPAADDTTLVATAVCHRTAP